jgi:glutathione S-transferase
VAPQAGFLSSTPEWATLTAPHPNLLAWIERLEARPSFRATTVQTLLAGARAA